MVKKSAWLVGFALSLQLVWPAAAQELRIALVTEPSALDPHFRASGPDGQIARHFFDSLILQDDQQRLMPGLALSWRAVNDTTWEFHVRPNVRFSDGSELTAADVAVSLRRAPAVPNSPGGYGIYTRQITSIEVIDPHTVRLHTASPYALMPNDLSPVGIVSRGAEAASTDDFNSGRTMIGTGPFRLVEWIRGERLVMERNELYWGPKPAWKRVVARFIPNDVARVAALLSREVDFIELVPPSALADLRGHGDVRIAEALSNRVIYLHLDQYRDRTPFATDLAGAPLERNPLQDLRVRQAISKAIDRQAITEHIMEGLATPAAQLVPDGYFGASTSLRPEPYDPEGSRRLLAAAGYPSGFGLTLHASNNRYVNDEKVAIAIGQMLSRVGIQTRIETLPESVYKTRASKYEFSFFKVGWFSETAEASGPLRGMVASRGLRGWGQANRGRYSNPDLDRVLMTALETFDDQARESLLQRAMEMAMQDIAVVPLYFEGAAWAFRQGLSYKGRTDQFTLAQEVIKVP